MREIKFRGWDIYREKMWSPHEMGEDELTINPDGRGFVNVSGTNRKLSQYMKHIIPLQYTGLKDKNGKEGYHKNIWTDGLHKYLVEWIDKKACFVLKGITITREYSMAHFSEGEIIGNIYKNPKFLEA